MRQRLRLWWRRRSQIRELKKTEIWLFHCGPHDKWRKMRRSNDELGVWDGTYKYDPDFYDNKRRKFLRDLHT